MKPGHRPSAAVVVADAAPAVVAAMAADVVATAAVVAGAVVVVMAAVVAGAVVVVMAAVVIAAIAEIAGNVSLLQEVKPLQFGTRGSPFQKGRRTPTEKFYAVVVCPEGAARARAEACVRSTLPFS
jgi:hypothetical protein